MLGPFTFEAGGRTYACAPERRNGSVEGAWWWFRVSSDSQVYAPFEATSSDTRSSVRARIIAYYEHRVWARAQPAAPRDRFGQPGKAGQPGRPAKAPGSKAKPRG